MTMHIAHLTSEIDDYEYRSGSCYYDDCTESPILSHTISRNYIYKLNSDPRKVLMLQQKITPIRSKPNPSLVSRINIERFACFTGFCPSHDFTLFKSLDMFDGKLDKEKAALAHYRNICYGINHIKTQMLRESHMASQCFVQGESSDASANKLNKMLKKRYFAKRLSYCLEQHLIRKAHLEKMIQSKNFNDIRCIEFRGGLDNPIFCGRSSYLLHQKDKFFTQHGYCYMPWLSYTTLLTDVENHLVFCWLKKDDVHARLFNKPSKNEISKDDIATLAWACSDAFAVEETIYTKHKIAIDMAIRKLRVY